MLNKVYVLLVLVAAGRTLGKTTLWDSTLKTQVHLASRLIYRIKKATLRDSFIAVGF
jgi:hypothetical protein